MSNHARVPLAEVIEATGGPRLAAGHLPGDTRYVVPSGQLRTSSKTSTSIIKPGKWLQIGRVAAFPERRASTEPMGCWQRWLARSSGVTHGHHVSGTAVRPQPPSRPLGVTIML